MLTSIIDFILFKVFHLDPSLRLAQSLHFFIYDSIKIILMLFVMISVIGFLRTYVAPSKVKYWLSSKHPVIGYTAAALFGSLTPFCSCSSIPIFLSFLEVGVPLGVTLCFLITSPLINEYLVLLMASYFGIKITIFYVLSGLVIGITSGMILGRMNLEKYLEKDLIKTGNNTDISYLTFRSRFLYGITEAVRIVKKLWKWILLGIGIGALIHNFVPDDLIHSVVSAGGVFTVPLAVIMGVPLYGNCAAIVPIALVLFKKGVPLGAALALMMAISALSLPEAVILRRAMKLRLITIFFLVVALGIIFTGYLFNLLETLIL
ncbi:permease [Thermoproteota archaeon]